MNATRVIVLSMGIVVGILLVALVARTRIAPGLIDFDSRGGAEIVLTPQDGGCRVRHKTKKFRVKTGFTAVWNIQNNCSVERRVTIQFTGASPVSEELSAPVSEAKGNTPGIHSFVAKVTAQPAQFPATYHYQVCVEKECDDDPDLIIDRW